jgi:hypothetical protein
MQSWKRVAPIAVPFLIIVAVTDVSYFFKDVAHARHLVFLPFADRIRGDALR